MTNHYLFLALDLANERVHEAALRNRAFQTDELPLPTPGVARRSLARFAAAVSRQSAVFARRLDESARVDDLEGDCVPA